MARTLDSGESVQHLFEAADIKLSLNADNLFVWTKYSGMDPDVSSSNALFTGFDRLSYPKARSFTFGVNLSF